MDNRPNCYKCKHRCPLSYSAHSSCKNVDAKVKGDEHGIRSGWFYRPTNFDPTRLDECDGFEPVLDTNQQD